MSEKLNAETTIKFIKKFQQYECLWNPKHVLYKNKQMWEACYQKIKERMVIPGFKIAEVKSKMQNLKSTYYKKKKKIDESKYLEAVQPFLCTKHKMVF